MSSFLQDLRAAIRNLRTGRHTSLIVIGILALGIAATTMIFSVIDSVLLNPFPYRDAGRLAEFRVYLPNGTHIDRFPISTFGDFRDDNHIFEDVIGLSFADMRYKRGNVTEEFFGGWVTPNAFEVLGVKPLLGRPIKPSDGEPGSPPVFAMSYQLWTRLFDRDPKILGSTISLNGVSRTLVAIMPPRFRFGSFGPCEAWLPLKLTKNTWIPAIDNQPIEVWIVGRLKSGIGLHTASADLSVIASRLEKEFPLYFRPGYTLQASLLKTDYVGNFELTLLGLMAAVTMLLLIACSNAANLLLARATARESEIAIRVSLGAQRSRLIRLFLAESLSLATVSCGVGCVVAYLGLKALVTILPPDTVPTEVEIALRPIALCFASSVTILVTFFCGIVPAIHCVGPDLSLRLRAGSKGASTPHQHGRLRNILVVAQVALSIVLLVGVGLALRSVVALEAVDLGFDPEKVMWLRLSLPDGRYNTAAQLQAFFRRLLDRVKAVPGVVSAAEATNFPPYRGGWSTITVPGRVNEHQEQWGATTSMPSEGFFETTGRRLLSGRTLTQGDVDSAQHVIVVNQTFAKRYFAGTDPLGQSIRLTSWEAFAKDWPREPFFQIIGVVNDAKNHGLYEPPSPEVFFPSSVTAVGPRGMLVRTQRDADVSLATVTKQVSALDSDVVIVESGSVGDFVKSSYYARPKFTLVMIGSFASIGLLLVIAGIFGVTAYTVSLRTREFGIRMALGARQGDIERMVVKNMLLLVTIGTLIGVLASLSMKSLFASMIWGIPSSDPPTLTAVFVMITLVAMIASWIPARRAARVDPWVALRHE